MAGEEELERHVQAEVTRELAEGDKPLIYRLAVVGHRSYVSQVEMQERMRQQYPPPEPIACAEGCAYCCHVTVAVTVAELAAIMHTVARWPREELRALGDRVEELAKTRREMSLEQLRQTRMPCPLLDEKTGACRVYDVRPLRCRGHNSMDVKKCEAYFFGKESETPVYLPQMATAQAIYQGLRAALAERLKTTPMMMHLELVSGLDIAFTLTPEQWGEAASWQSAAMMNATPEMWTAMFGVRNDDPDA